MNYFQKRKIKRMAQDILRHVQHLRNMREDIMADSDKQKINEAEAKLIQSLRAGDIAKVEQSGNMLYDCVSRMIPQRSFSGFRENLEVLVVAVAVAMAVKAYFLQPFKIPTGSMQPTLNGVTLCEDDYKPGIMDQLPFKFVKWIITGESYKKVVVSKEGILNGWYDTRYSGGDNKDPVYMYCIIAGKKYKVPEKASIGYGNNTFVPKGTVLWAGVINAGDHVFVDKIRWNFQKPKRGDIIVFKTNNIKDISRGTHYIKRLVGLPGETLSITPPYVFIDDEALTKPWQIARIEKKEEGYYGYRNDGYLSGPDVKYDIPSDGYFAMGDNTPESFDSRFWGKVPRENMMGPALFVYWPFTRHWGFANSN